MMDVSKKLRFTTLPTAAGGDASHNDFKAFCAIVRAMDVHALLPNGSLY